MVNITKVNSEYNHQTAYCEEESITTLSAAINRRVLWSGYEVRPMEPLGPPLGADVNLEGIGGLPIRFQSDKVKNKFSGSDIKATNEKKRPSSMAMVLEPKRKWTRETQNLRVRTRIDLFGEARSVTF